MTVTGAPAVSEPPLPFRPSASPPSSSRSAEPASGPGDLDAHDTEPPTLRHAELAKALPPPLVAAPLTPISEPPAPPPLVARAGLVEPAPPTPRSLRIADPSPPAPPPPPLPPPPPPRPTVESSIERCAAVAARLATPDADADAVLALEQVTPEAFGALHARWLAAIDAELDRGRKKLLVSYDAAYVAALEEARGPIEPNEYARLSIAAERSKAAPLLKELGLPTDAMMRIQRVWLARMVADPRRAAEVRAAKRRAAEE